MNSKSVDGLGPGAGAGVEVLDVRVVIMRERAGEDAGVGVGVEVLPFLKSMRDLGCWGSKGGVEWLNLKAVAMELVVAGWGVGVLQLLEAIVRDLVVEIQGRGQVL